MTPAVKSSFHLLLCRTNVRTLSFRSQGPKFFDSLSLEIQNAPSFVSCGTNVRTLSIRSQGPNLFNPFALTISLVILVTGQVARESSRPKSCRPKPARNFLVMSPEKKKLSRPKKQILKRSEFQTVNRQ